MKTNTTKQSVERTFLSLERNALSEERTILAYIRTELAFIGVIVLILRFYFEEYMWSVPVSFLLMLVFAVILGLEIAKIKRLRIRRRELQRKQGKLV